MWGRRGWTGRNKPTLFCANDERVQINDSSRRRGVWSNRRASQMQLTQGIVNAHSTLQNIISPRLPPRYIWKPNKFVWRRPFPRSQRRQGFVHGRAAAPAAPPAAARLRGSAAAERGSCARPGVSGGGSPSPGSASAAPGSQRLARILPESWRRRRASGGEPRLEPCGGAATGTGSGAGWPPGCLEAGRGL